ncbi:MAG: sporulation protein YtfJ [Clostridia bacterium]|nr:sporulation protein YtfJ [Clostridia bacterium]
MENTVSEIMTSTVENLKKLVDADTVIGTPIEANGTVIIPVSKVSVGVAAGGADGADKNQSKHSGGGGSGSGIKVTPVCFIAVTADGDVKILNTSGSDGTQVEDVIAKLPGLFGKVKDFFKERAEEKKAKKAAAEAESEEDAGKEEDEGAATE